MDILSDKTVKTRKDHTCDACFSKIPKGSKAHVHVNGVDEIWRTCMTCYELTTNHRGQFEDTDGICYAGCVHNHLFEGRTPEMLLEVLNTTEDIL